MVDVNKIKNLSKTTAEKIAISFLEKYKNSPYSNELSSDKIKFFFYNNDFEAGLNNELFWEFKRLDLWQKIDDNTWDEITKLAMNTAYKAFMASNKN